MRELQCLPLVERKDGEASRIGPEDPPFTARKPGRREEKEIGSRMRLDRREALIVKIFIDAGFWILLRSLSPERKNGMLGSRGDRYERVIWVEALPLKKLRIGMGSPITGRHT